MGGDGGAWSAARRARRGAGCRLAAREKVILIVLPGAGFMGSVDFSVLNVALPFAGGGVGMTTRTPPWIQSAIALPAAGFTLLFGRLGDLFGRRRMFLLGTSLLLGGSVLGGAAVNQQTRACLEPIALTSPRLWSYQDFPRRGLSPPGNSGIIGSLRC